MTLWGKKKNPYIDPSLLAFAAWAALTAAICYAMGREVFQKGFGDSVAILVQVFPKMVGAILVAGFVQVLIPREKVIKWIGKEAGFKGIVIACLAGILTPGGPMVSFPLISALYAMDAAIGTLVAYLLSWELMGIQRLLIWDIPIMGINFTVLRLALSFFFPLLSGALAQKLADHLKPDTV